MEDLVETSGNAKATRAEWIAFAAFLLNVGTLVFGLGVVWGDVQEHERRLTSQETKMDALVPKVELDGTTVAATTPAQVMLPAGQAISITYTVAPTWVWYGL